MELSLYDGSFQMNIQELANVKRYNLPIKIFVLDNNRLGIVSQFQLLNWDSDQSTVQKITLLLIKSEMHTE